MVSAQRQDAPSRLGVGVEVGEGRKKPQRSQGKLLALVQLGAAASPHSSSMDGHLSVPSSPPLSLFSAPALYRWYLPYQIYPLGIARSGEKDQRCWNNERREMNNKKRRNLFSLTLLSGCACIARSSLRASGDAIFDFFKQGRSAAVSSSPPSRGGVRAKGQEDRGRKEERKERELPEREQLSFFLL